MSILSQFKNTKEKVAWQSRSQAESVLGKNVYEIEDLSVDSSLNKHLHTSWKAAPHPGINIPHFEGLDQSLFLT